MSFILIQETTAASGKRLSYAHLTTSAWNAKRGRSEQSRSYLGTVSEDGSEVVLSKRFRRRGGQSVPLDELRRMAGDPDALRAWLSEGDPECGVNSPAAVETIGDALALLSLAEESGVVRLLVDVFGAEDGQALAGLAIHQVATGNPLYLAGDWLSERALPDGMRGRAVSMAEVYGLMLRVGADTDARERFFRAWVAELGAEAAVVCDTTSISSYSPNLDLAEWGYNRDGENLPQVNVALAVSPDGAPLWYRLVPGSVPDVATLEVSAGMLRDLGVNRVSYSLDRGFYSKTNLRDLLKSGDGFTIGAPMTDGRTAALIREHRLALASPKRSFVYRGRVLRHARGVWSVAMGGKEPPRRIEAHVFLDQARQAEQVERLEKTVFALVAKATKEVFPTKEAAAEWIQDNAKGLAGCLAAVALEDGAVVTRKPRGVASAAACLGMAVLLVSKMGMPPEEALAATRSRDYAEKLFDVLKNEDGQFRLRTGSDVNAEGRMFLAFVSLVFHAALERRMRERGMLEKLTVAELLAKSRKVKSVTTRSGKKIFLEVPKKVREIFARLGVALPA